MSIIAMQFNTTGVLLRRDWQVSLEDNGVQTSLMELCDDGMK